MKLLEQIDAKYVQAKRELDKVISGRHNTAQARYDRKKALARGYEPKRYTAGIERIRHELDVERRWVLKGAAEALEYLLEHYQEFDTRSIGEWLEEELGNVEAALDEGTEEDPEGTD